MLDTLQKVADIAQKGIVAVALAIGGYLVTRDQSAATIGKSCDEMFTKILDYVTINELTDRTLNIVDYRLETYGKACGTLSPDRLRYVKSSWKDPPRRDTASAGTGRIPSGTQQSAAEPRTIGWVALSRIPAQRYNDTNFDRVDKPNGTLAETGAVISPRWQVNVRKSNTSVATTDNPVVDQVVPGECLRIITTVAGQINSWAEVADVTCPRPSL